MRDSRITRRRVIQGAATVAAASVIPGFVRSAEAQTTIVVTIPSLTEYDGYMPSNFVGLSYDKLVLNTPVYSDQNGSHRLIESPALANFFATANVQVLRLADGSVTNWQQGGAGLTSGQIAPNDVHFLTQFLLLVGIAFGELTPPSSSRCSCIYGINLGGTLAKSGTDPAPTTTGQAEAEMWQVNDDFSKASPAVTLLGIEVGNEPDNYGGTYYSSYNPPAPLQGPWNQANFEALWAKYAAAADPSGNMNITGPAFGNGDNAPWLISGFANDWTSTYSKTVKGPLTLLTQHYYAGLQDSDFKYSKIGTTWYETGSEPGLLTPYPSANLTNTILNNLGKAKQQNNLPNFRISECNSWDQGGYAGISDKYGAALWAIDFMFTCANYGCNGVNFHCGGPSATTYNPLPFSVNAGVLTLSAAPLYYGILLASMAGSGQMLKLNYTVNTYVTVFAVWIPGTTEYNFIINNKDDTSAYAVELSLPTGATATNVTTIALTTTAPSDPLGSAATNVYLQGKQMTANGTLPNYTPTPISGGNSISVNIPLASALLVRFNA